MAVNILFESRITTLFDYKIINNCKVEIFTYFVEFYFISE